MQRSSLERLVLQVSRHGSSNAGGDGESPGIVQDALAEILQPDDAQHPEHALAWTRDPLAEQEAARTGM